MWLTNVCLTKQLYKIQPSAQPGTKLEKQNHAFLAIHPPHP